ncbi:hypothetical protein SUGI_0068000 [Cryptomeria japonica]|nr:hypothetical protein SUGI_0068000 [Cryptomeria japonica]
MKVGKDGKGENVGKSRTETSGSENGVMFPRLHVKETKTDGPRAPPRNKMALYEQFTIPSHRFMQSTNSNPRQNPTSVINQPASCDGRFMYAPYYVSPHVYPTVNFPGQFLGQNVMSCSNSAATESDKSTKCDQLRSTQQSSHSSPRDHNVQCNQNPFSSHMNHDEDLTLQASRKLKNSDVKDGMMQGGSHLLKKGQKTSNPIVRSISENLRTLPLQVDSRLKYPVHQGLSSVIQDDETEPRDREPELCKDSSQSPFGDSYCADDVLNLDKHPNEGAGSRVEYEDNVQNKKSIMSDNNANSKGINTCSSIRESQAYVQQSHRAREHLKASSARAESQYLVEVLSRDSDEDIDGCHKEGQSNQNEILSDQGDSSDQNSDSSMVDSLHAFEITPKSVISAIGQKEFWRVRKAILRQQKIFSTQVFELHRLVKVQKLIAMPSNLLIEENIYKSFPISISEEQCVPTIDPEKCTKSFEDLVDHDCEIVTAKAKPCNKEMLTHYSLSSHQSPRESVQPIANDTRDQSHAATFPVGTFSPGSASAWGYPAYPQHHSAMPASPGCYGYYHQYPLNQMGVPNAVMGIPCSLEGNSIGSRNMHRCQHQCQCSAEHQTIGLGHFPKYPSQDGLRYSSPTPPVPFEPFRPAGKACHPFFKPARIVGNGSEEMSAGSFRSESVLKQSKQTGQPGLHSKKTNEDAHECESPNTKELNEDDAGVPDVVDLENQALSLFPLSSSFLWSSKTVKDKALFSSKEERVQVIKAVPRTAMAASESTADILLSLQRERQQ